MKMKVFVFVLVGLCCVFAFCLSFSSSAEDHAEVVALNDLLGCVYQSEVIYADLQWVLEAFERFENERSWESLQLARAALSIAKRDIESRSLPKLAITSDEQAALMKRGIDLSFMSGFEASFSAEQIGALNTCRNLASSIMYDVFLRDDWEIAMHNVRMLERLNDCNIQYLANTVDWVLASINNKAVSKKFNALLEEHCPLTRAHQAKETLSREKIEVSTHELLNRIGELAVEGTKIIGERNDRLNFMCDVLARNDLKLLAKNIRVISGMPNVIFLPSWFDIKDIYYYWQEDGKIVSSPRPGTKLERVPDGCRIRISGVSLDEVAAYRHNLESAGLTFSRTSTPNEIACEYGDSLFAITWDNGTVTILLMENPVCFVPIWYVPALRSLKQ